MIISTINFSRKPNLVLPLVGNLPINTKMLDLIGAISDSDHILRLSDIDPEGNIEENAVNELIQFVGKLSVTEVNGKSIRSFTVFDETLFWFSPLAEKHGFHWGKNVFTLFYILKNNSDLFSDEVTVILPHSLFYIKSFIEDYFISLGREKPTLIIVGSSISRYDNWHYIKNCLKNLFTAIRINQKLKKIKGVSFNGRFLFISKAAGVWNSSNHKDGDLDGVFNFISGEGKKMYIPYFSSLSNLEHNWQFTDQEFINSFPTKIDAFKLFAKQMKLLLSVNLLKKKYVKAGELQLQFDMICIEFLKAANSDYFINYLWFRNYFATIKESRKIFFTDEFYTSGRLISAAARFAKNININCFGVQHGLFNPYHTVYRISDREIEDHNRGKNDGLPMPGNFVVWGDYFKKIFLRYNTLGDEFVVVAGNLKYITLDKTDSKLNSGGVNILWCTTLIYHFKKEYEVLAPVLKEIGNYKLVFRLHPVGHITDREILESLEPEILGHTTISKNRDIFKDIKATDVVISSSSSTTFLDALLLDKLSVRVMNGTSRTNFMDEKVRNLVDITTSDQFRNAVLSYHGLARQTIKGELEVNDIFYLKDDVWKVILN